MTFLTNGRTSNTEMGIEMKNTLTKFTNTSNSVVNAHVSTDVFTVAIHSITHQPGKKYHRGWNNPMWEIETNRGVYISEDDFTGFINQQLEVTSKKYVNGWSRLNKISSDNSRQQKLIKPLKIGTDTYYQIEDALNALKEHKPSYVYQIEFGMASYVGFTTKSPEQRIEEHIEAARNNSKSLVHIEMRRWGFQFKFDVLDKTKNEILGLLSEIAHIEKLKPTLNKDPGGSGNNFNIVEFPNDDGEAIFYVLDKKNLLGN